MMDKRKERQMRKKEKKQRPNIAQYLRRYKLWIFLYAFFYVIASVGDVFFTILLARSVELITVAKYKNAIITVAIVIGINIVQRVCWYLCSYIYYKKGKTRMNVMGGYLPKKGMWFFVLTRQAMGKGWSRCL